MVVVKDNNKVAVRCRCNNQIKLTAVMGSDIGCWCLTTTMGYGIGRCGQWTTTTQLATECGDCKKATMGRGGGGGHGNEDNSKKEVVEEGDGKQ
jgi:hypothetical protein